MSVLPENVLRSAPIHSTVALAGLLVLTLMLAGCETPGGTAAQGTMDGATAATAGAPNEAAASGTMANVANTSPAMQQQTAVAEAGKHQVLVNENLPADARVGSITQVSKLTLDDGALYTGQLKLSSDHKWYPHGSGFLSYVSGEKYRGEFKDGKYDGRGVLSYPDGGQWEGAFKDNKPNGSVKYTKGNESNVQGEWVDDRCVSCRGIVSWPDGSKYEGQWNFDDMRGKGTITWSDGRHYSGDWRVFDGKPDLPDGEGAMSWTDGRKYAGQFREGRLDGFGKMAYADGKVEEGLWRDDKFVGALAQAASDPSAVAGGKTGSVTVAADDGTFEVFVDGSFVGNSPAKLKLAQGQHVIEVKKAGFKDYKRELEVSEGAELNLKATLEKQ